MPQIYTREFKVRYYECDAYAHLNNTVYARYMQEVALDAATIAGYGYDWCVANQRAFWVRSSDIEYLRPALFGDRIVVNTWVDEMRRTQSRRRYELRRASNDELICRAHTRWVYMASDSGRLLSCTPEMQAAFMGQDPQATYEPGEAPPPAPLPIQPYVVRKSVQFRDIDQMQHMNNAAYLDYFEQTGHEAGEAFGWPPERLIEANAVTVLRRLWVDYLLPARMNDELELTAWLSHVRPASALRHITMKRAADGATLARCVYLIANVNLKTGAPIRWNKRVLADVAANISIMDESQFAPNSL